MFPVVLGVGFRLVTPVRDHWQGALCLDHTPHHSLAFKCAFSSDDDEVVADGVCAWIADSNHIPDGSCVHHLAQRVEKDTPFSPQLRWMGIRLIERTWRNELRVSELETIHLLNHLNVGMGDIRGTTQSRKMWAEFLVDVICSPVGLNVLSIHYWHLLEWLPCAGYCSTAHIMKVVKLLEQAEDWEKLEVWIVIVWRSFWLGLQEDSESEENLEPEEDTKLTPNEEHLKQVTLNLFLKRPSALPRFEAFSRSETIQGKLVPKDTCVSQIVETTCAQA